MDQELDLRKYLIVLRRRIPHFVVPFVMIFVAACTVVYLLPAIYHASAKILVETQQIPNDLARSTVTSAATERIAVIRQRLMTRSNLLQIVADFGLFKEKQNRLSPTEIVEKMRESAKIEQIDISRRRNSRQQAVAFTVSFEYSHARQAARVANKFVELILEQNIQSRTNRASKTHKFFERQVEALEKEVALKETSIVKFKGENEDSLPDSLAYRRALLTDIQSRLPAIDQKIQVLAEQKTLLKQGEEVVVIDPIEKELSTLQAQIKQLRANYSDRHPAVKRALNRVAALEKALQEAAATKPANAAPETGDEDANEAASFSPEVTNKLALIDRQLTSLAEQRDKELERITALEQTLAKTPKIEILLNSLNREYKALELRLSQARAKMAEAATGEQLEEDRQGERFEVIEQATTPSKPSKPERPRLVLAGFFVSIAAGVGIVLLFEMLDKSIRTGADLHHRLQMRPLSTIPFVVTAADRSKRIRLIWGGLIGMATTACVSAGMIHVFYKPLDVVWIKILQRIPL